MKKNLGFRVGLGVSGLDGEDGQTIPVAVNYFRGKNHLLDISIGFLYKIGIRPVGTGPSHESNGIDPLVSVGYRYKPPASGFLYRAGFNTITLIGKLINREPESRFKSIINVGVGYAF